VRGIPETVARLPVPPWQAARVQCRILGLIPCNIACEHTHRRCGKPQEERPRDHKAALEQGRDDDVTRNEHDKL
jgi:hypothetical protein